VHPRHTILCENRHVDRTAERTQILICGSYKAGKRRDFNGLVRELGRRLIQDTTWRIMIGGYGTFGERLSTVDELIAGGVADALLRRKDVARQRILTMLPESPAGNNYFRYGRAITLADTTPRERRAEMVKRADVVLAIGGGGGAADIIDQTYAADKPLLPLAFTGGAAAEVWKRYHALLIKRYSLSSEDINLIERGGKNPSTITRDIIELLRRLGSRVTRTPIIERPTPRVKSIRRRRNNREADNGKLRLVLASPGDVTRERAIVKKVVGEINRGVAADRQLDIQVVAWETDTYPGFHDDGAQGVIDPLLRIEDCDLLVGIFWKRFGTPVKDAKSGTEHEIKKALASWQKRRRPHVMLYFSTKPYAPKNSAETTQWTQVLEFRAEFQNKGLLGTYATHKQFEDYFRDHLTLHIRTKYSLRKAA